MRNLLMFVAATVATIFTFILLAAPTAHAADVVWDSESLSYGGNTYQKSADAGANDSRGFQKGTHIYTYIEGGDASGASGKTSKAHIIYFPPGTDPTKAKTAKYAVFDFTPPDTYKNPTGQKDLSIEEKSKDSNGTSCSIPGIGWLICPVSSFMARSMDWLYSNVLTQFLAVRPVQSNTDNSLFKAWAIMRNFANVAFVIAFLIIIWSQVSSMGISNYGIKKLLPRLVVAAVLVNVSYWICAVAIDVSNILGYSVNDLLMSITKSVQKSGSNTEGFVSWESITAAVLSGGTLAAAGVTALIAVGSVSGAIAMLLPILVGVLIAALVAIIIMAARQAIIVILVIISPLAFVAYLLPNTEKYFERWRELFTTMLVLFPIFGVIFGGSQLAGTAIIQNADSIIMLILGMAVQIAPLVLLPFLIKFSGSLLGRIAGVANNRSKGFLDETRNYAKSVADSRKAKNLSRPDATWRRNALTRAVQAKDNGRRKREGMTKAYEALADARWEGHKNARQVHEATARATLTKEAAEARSEAHIEEMKRTNASMQDLDLRARAAKLSLDLSKAKVETNWEELKTGSTTAIVTPEGLSSGALSHYLRRRDEFAQSVQDTALDAAAVGMRQDAAKRQQITDTSQALLQHERTVDGQDVLTYSGGIQGAIGEEAALSKAVTAQRKQLEENIMNNLQLMKHFNITMAQKSELALGDDIKGKRPDGSTFTFSGTNVHAREAAIDEVMSSGPYRVTEQIIQESGATVKDPETGEIRKGKTHDYADTISRLIAGKADKKALFWGSAITDKIARGEISGAEGRYEAVTYHIQEGKVKAEALASMDPIGVEHMFEVALDPSKSERYVTKPADYARNVRQLRETVKQITETEILRRNANARSLQHMHDFLERTGGRE